MTTAADTRIWQDTALVIDPRHLGISASGTELQKLFVDFCNQNSQNPWQFELSPDGEIIAMPPVHYPSDDQEGQVFGRLLFWTDDNGGQARNSNASFLMPNGGVLVPDASWTSQENWESHPHVPGDANPFCPDFVVEIRSTSDNLPPLHAKMRLYMENGALLGWLIDPTNRQVYVYRAGQDESERLDDPRELSGEDVLPGFVFDIARWIFDRH